MVKWRLKSRNEIWALAAPLKFGLADEGVCPYAIQALWSAISFNGVLVAGNPHLNLAKNAR